jgi:hypothetical protein
MDNSDIKYLDEVLEIETPDVDDILGVDQSKLTVNTGVS